MATRSRRHHPHNIASLPKATHSIRSKATLSKVTPNKDIHSPARHSM